MVQREVRERVTQRFGQIEVTKGARDSLSNLNIFARNQETWLYLLHPEDPDGNIP
jgi:hypothetical protein